MANISAFGGFLKRSDLLGMDIEKAIGPGGVSMRGDARRSICPAMIPIAERTTVCDGGAGSARPASHLRENDRLPGLVALYRERDGFDEC